MWPCFTPHDGIFKQQGKNQSLLYLEKELRLRISKEISLKKLFFVCKVGPVILMKVLSFLHGQILHNYEGLSVLKAPHITQQGRTFIDGNATYNQAFRDSFD